MVPFVVELMLAVSLTAYVAYRHSHDALNKLANQLMIEVSDRVEDHVDHYLEAPIQVTNAHVDAIQSGLLNWQNSSELEKYFSHRLQSSQESKRQLYSLLLADSKKVVGVERHPHQGWSVYQQQEKNWFQVTQQTQQGTWQLIPVNPTVEEPSLIAVYLQHFFDANRRAQGIVGASIDLANLNQYLSNLRISPRGQAFIVESSGALVATSTKEPLIVRSKSGVSKPSTDSRLLAYQSLNTPIRDAAAYLKQNLGGFANISEKQQFSFEVDRKQYFVQVTPLHQINHLDWLLLVVIPEADFAAQLNHQYQMVLMLSGMALLGAIALGLATAQRITRPILRLSRASQDLMLGKLDAPVSEQTRITELAVMAHSFNEMTEHLMESFDQVKLALQESKEKFTTVFRTSPDPILVSTLPEGTVLEFNASFLRLTGYSHEEVLGKTALELGLWPNLEDRTKLMQAIQETGRVCDQEVITLTRYGTRITVLLSSEQIEIDGKSCLLTVAKDISERKRLEEALRQSEAKLQDVLNSAAAAICYFYLDDAGLPQPIYFSAGVETIFGYSPDVLLRDPSVWSSRVHPQDLQTLIRPGLAKVTQNPVYTEYRYYHPEGGLRWIAVDANARWDDTQNRWLMTSVEFDITDRKQTEEALRLSEARFRMAFDTAAIGMDIASLRGQLLQVNPALCQMLGYSETELLQMNYRDVTHPDDWEIDHVANQQILSRDVTNLSFEKRFIHRDGQIIWVLLTLALIRDGQDQPLYWVAQVQNITARKQIASALQQSESRFRAVFETATVGIAIVDLAGHILEVNEALCHICGFLKAELQQMKQLQEVIHPEDWPRWSTLMEQLNSQRIDHYQLKIRCIHKNKGFIWTQLTTIFVRGGDRQPLYFVIRLEPISRVSALEPGVLSAFKNTYRHGD